MSNPTKFIDNRQFHKSNYSDALKSVIPSLYFEEDYARNNKKIDVLDQVINSHLKIINNFSSIINISAIAGTAFSGINSPSGIAPFFIKQNDLTNIDTNDFERRILVPLSKSFRDFNSSAEFSDFLKDELLPGIRLNSPTLDFVGNGQASSNHTYLINNLSWFYFLNLSGPTSLAYNSSSYVHDALVARIYERQDLKTNDGIKGLTNYVWKNYTTQSWSSLGVLPSDFLPSVESDFPVWTSGTQQLDKLLTLVDVVYSPLYIDDGDLKVKNAIDDFLENSYLLTDKKFQGPFLNLLKAFSFAFADSSNQIDRIESLNDLDECPDEYLPLLADLIGWRLFGSEPDRWRLQLANAVNIYKTVGTKKCVQLVADSMFGQDVFDASSTISELWESYVPFLIQYALATESPLLRDFSTWNTGVALSLGVSAFSPSSMDENIKICVDKIVQDIVFEFPESFYLGQNLFDINSPEFVFNYRNKQNKVPPFEEIPYYTKVIVTDDLIKSIEDRLICFEVPEDFALKVGNYIRKYTIDNVDDYSITNSWLFFTPSAEYSPNWNSVIRDITNSRIDYLPLWNGKSSHFQSLLDTSNFNFGKTSLEADSKEVLYMVAEAIKEFSPAKAIPSVIARSSTEDEITYNGDYRFPTINIPKADFGQVSSVSSNALAGFGMSALAMSTYKRGLTPTSVSTFTRKNADTIVDSLTNPNGTVALLPRRTHRRRDFKHILPKEGYYDRGGFNMPSQLQNYIISGSLSGTFFPLGLVPSSMQFVPIPDYNNIPPIYGKCEDLSSSSVYSGVAVSNTFPVRGWVQN